MEWTDQKDILFLREALVSDLYETRKGSPERGKVWDIIASHLNKLNKGFTVNKRSLRDRLNLLQTKFKAKTREEERASGISPEQSEIDTLLEELCGKEEARCTSLASNKKKAVQDKASAQEIRQKAMESMGDTRKRKENNRVSSSKRIRRSTSDALGILEEKAKLYMSLRKEELELRKREEAKSTLLAEQQSKLQQEMLKVIQQQQQEQQKQQKQQQQQQLQSMQAMFQQQHQILTLFEKFAPK